MYVDWGMFRNSQIGTWFEFVLPFSSSANSLLKHIEMNLKRHLFAGLHTSLIGKKNGLLFVLV